MELIGANARSIAMAENREEFSEAMNRIGLDVAHGGFAKSLEDAYEIVEATGYPAIVRPSFTLGGTGGGIAYNLEELEVQVRKGIDASPIHEVLIDRSVIGWKEFELEVVRDAADNVIVVCSIENFDAMGVHTGDSVTVAPVQTLTDVEYQSMRDAAIAIIREIGVEAGGCNIQFAVSPESGEMLVVEMNPRVSRSQRTGVQGYRVPDRSGGRQASGWLLAPGAAQRHHQDDTGFLRARARLRGGKVPALRVREISRGGSRAGCSDEVGRRDHGYRSHLPRCMAKGAPRSRDRPSGLGRCGSASRTTGSSPTTGKLCSPPFVGLPQSGCSSSRGRSSWASLSMSCTR